MNRTQKNIEILKILDSIRSRFQNLSRFNSIRFMRKILEFHCTRFKSHYEKAEISQTTSLDNKTKYCRSFRLTVAVKHQKFGQILKEKT